MKQKTIKVLREINKRVFDKYKGKLETEVDKFETAQKIISHYEDPKVYKTLNEKQKEALEEMQTAKEAGLFEGTKMVPNEKEITKFEKELDKAIDKAIKDGEIPDPKSTNEMSSFRKKIKKLTKKNNE